MLTKLKSILAALREFWHDIETKVKASGLAAFAAGLAIALLNALQANSALLGGLSPTVQFLLIASIPAVITALAGYQAKHTYR